MKFAKLFETIDGGQVLLTVNENEEDDNWGLEMRTDFEGGVPKMTLSFKSEEDAKGAMDKYSQASAEKFRKEMSEYF